MGQQSSAAAITEEEEPVSPSGQMTLRNLSERHNQFVTFYYTSGPPVSGHHCGKIHPECRLYSTLYVSGDGKKAALGFVDADNQFQPTTTAMAFVGETSMDWWLVGTELSNNNTVVIKCRSGCFTFKNRTTGLRHKLHLH